MILVSVRTKRLKIAVVFLLITVIISLIVLAIASIRSKTDDKSNILETNEARIAYLNSCGWVVSNEAREITDVIIPSEFNEIYTEYNALQIEQGYDLTDYKGVTAKKYTYDIINYPSTVESVEANMLLYNDKIIGGDVSSTEQNGFMQGLLQTAAK